MPIYGACNSDLKYLKITDFVLRSKLGHRSSYRPSYPLVKVIKVSFFKV